MNAYCIVDIILVEEMFILFLKQKEYSNSQMEMLWFEISVYYIWTIELTAFWD